MSQGTLRVPTTTGTHDVGRGLAMDSLEITVLPKPSVRMLHP